MFNIAKLIKQLRYNEIECIDLTNETVPDYSKNPQITSFKLNHDRYPVIEKGWFNITALHDNYFACTNDENINICNADSKGCISILKCESGILSLQCLHDGRLISLLKCNSIDLWQPLKGQYLGRLIEHNDYMGCMTQLPLNCLATACNDYII